MTTLVREQTRVTEYEVAEATARAYVAYEKAVSTLPHISDFAEADKQRYFDVLHRLSGAFTPTLALASLMFIDASEVEEALGVSYPRTLPRFISLLANIFVLFGSARSAGELVLSLPTAKTVQDAFDPAILFWIKDCGVDIAAV
jgi:hypothetical protein